MPNDTYKPNVSGRDGESKSLVYDPITKTWVASSSSSVNTNIPDSGSDISPPATGTAIKDPYANTDSKGDADQEYITYEFNTLQGDLNIVPSDETIRINQGDTIKLHGVGKYLSGLYFVSAVTRNITKDGGYAHVLSLIKTGFGSSVKQVQPNVQEVDNRPKPKPVPVQASGGGPFNVGDKVKIVGSAVYSNADDGVSVPEWVKERVHTIDGVMPDGNRYRLKEIWSWTYVRYLQRV